MKEWLSVIVVSPFSPFPPYWGGASRIFNFVKSLSEYAKVTLLYNDVTQMVVGRHQDTAISQVANLGVEVIRVPSCTRISQILNPLMFLKLLLEIKKDKPAVVICEFPWQGLLVLTATRITNVPMILDEHNAEFRRFERMQRGNVLSRRVLRWYESLVARLADRVYCVSEVDRDTIISEFNLDAARVVVVQNGVDVASINGMTTEREVIRARYDIGEEEPIFIFHGKLDYPPNVEALRIISREIMPRLSRALPSARILVAGDNPPVTISEDPRFIVAGVVPRIAETIAACDAAICPLVSGGGTRIKIIEAVFCGLPVVSTSVGVEGIDISRFGGWIRIADDWDEFVKKMKECVGLRRVSQNNVSEMLLTYDWRYISKLVAEDIASLAGMHCQSAVVGSRLS